jgi:ABC-type transporter Mla maintaining outer membrane lipid asymmetry permease subunit MlaE
VIRPNRLVAAFLRNRAVVRGSISAAIVLSLVLFEVISFVWMVGPEVVSHDWLGIGKGHFSDSHISADGSHAGP